MAEKMEYAELQEHYRRLQADLEAVNQVLYDVRRQERTVKTLEAEYQEEIGALQAELENEKQKTKAKVQQMEESYSNLRTDCNDRVSYLESELERKEEEVKELKRDLNELIKNTEVRKPSSNDTLLEEFSQVKEGNLALSEHMEELFKSMESKDKENAALQDKIRQFEDELSNYKEILEGKRQELTEANALIQNLKDELLCTQSELQSLKSRPLDEQSRGNSLFAEVDDRRVQLQKNMKEMKTKYLEMRREHSSLVKQIHSLRNENITLIAEYKAAIDEKQFDEEKIIQTYKEQILILNERLDSCQKELKDKSESFECSEQGMRCFDRMLARKNEEIESWRQRASARSLNYNMMASDLAQVNKEARKRDLEILQLKNEIGSLKMQIQEMELKRTTETAPLTEETVTNAIVKNSPNEKIIKSAMKNPAVDDTDKENLEENDAVENKKVQFSESALDTNVTDRIKVRKGARILISKPIKFGQDKSAQAS